MAVDDNLPKIDATLKKFVPNPEKIPPRLLIEGDSGPDASMRKEQTVNGECGYKLTKEDPVPLRNRVENGVGELGSLHPRTENAGVYAVAL